MRVLFLFFLVLIVLPGCAPKLDNPQAPFPDQNIVENNAFFADEGRIFFTLIRDETTVIFGRK